MDDRSDCPGRSDVVSVRNCDRQADRHAESAVRGYCTQRVYKDRREEPDRLQSVLHRTEEEERVGGSLEDGRLESGASYDATLTGE